MDILHRVMFNTTSKNEFFRTVEDLGIITKTSQLPMGGGLLVVIEIYESAPHWSTVAGLISKYGASDRFETIFTEEEVRSAEWLRLTSTFEQGYPYPRGPWPFKQIGRTVMCERCAVYTQAAPIEIEKEPYFGRKSFVSLIWTNDVFCTQEVVQGLEGIKATGYEAWEVRVHKTRQASAVARQLFIQNIAAPGLLVEEEHRGSICPVCGVTKRQPHMRGVMHVRKEGLVANSDFMMTHEWFGNGYLAWREILVSNRVAQLVLDKGWQGVRFKVVELI